MNIKIQNILNEIVEDVTSRQQPLQEGGAAGAVAEAAAKSGLISGLLGGAKNAVTDVYKGAVNLPHSIRERIDAGKFFKNSQKNGFEEFGQNRLDAANAALKADAINAAKLGTPVLATAGGLGGLAALSGGDSETPPVVDQPVADPSVMDQIKQGASDAYQSASDAVSGINPYVAGGALAAALASGAGALYLRKKLKEQRG